MDIFEERIVEKIGTKSIDIMEIYEASLLGENLNADTVFKNKKMKIYKLEVL